jgi:hypothetical protein
MKNNDCIVKKKTKKTKNNYNLGKNVHCQSDKTKQISRWPNSCLIKAFMLDLNFFLNSMQNVNATQKSLPPIQFDYHIWKQI